MTNYKIICQVLSDCFWIGRWSDVLYSGAREHLERTTVSDKALELMRQLGLEMEEIDE